MKRWNASGMTLVEIMLAMALFVISVTSYLTLYMAYQKSKSDSDNSQIEKEVLLQNVLEVRGNKMAALPAKSRCVRRVYNLKKELKSETQFAMTSDKCARQVPQTGEVVIMWEVYGAEKIDISFEPTQGLKLPKYTDNIRQYDLIALSLSKGANPTLREMPVTIYKR